MEMGSCKEEVPYQETKNSNKSFFQLLAPFSSLELCVRMHKCVSSHVSASMAPLSVWLEHAIDWSVMKNTFQFTYLHKKLPFPLSLVPWFTVTILYFWWKKSTRYNLLCHSAYICRAFEEDDMVIDPLELLGRQIDFQIHIVQCLGVRWLRDDPDRGIQIGYCAAPVSCFLCKHIQLDSLVKAKAVSWWS